MIIKKWGAIITVFIGFAAGFGLSGFNKISAGLKAFQIYNKSEMNRIEEFWARTDLSESELRRFVNERSCHSTEKMFLACINSVVSVLNSYNERLGINAEIIKSKTDISNPDNFKEKENLLPFSKIYKAQLSHQFNFDVLWNKILNRATQDKPVRYLLAIGINGFLSVSRDPHTYILPLDFFEQMSLTSDRSKFFVGLRFEKKEGLIRLKQVVNQSDADIGGLKTGDIVLNINGKPTSEMNVAEATNLLKDQSIRHFSFTVKRDDAVLVKIVPRTYRVLSQVTSEIVTDFSSSTKNFGLIGISKFSKNTCLEVEKAIISMIDQKIQGIIIDLRDNPGGHLSEASCLLSLFIGEDKKAYSVEYFDVSKPIEVALTAKPRLFSGPLTVLVNSNSASASELFAGAVQEYRRGLVIGTSTFGKGTFQEIESWGDSDSIGFFLTKGFYLLPSGASTQFYGIKPDLEVTSSQVVVSGEQANYLNPIKPLNLSQVARSSDSLFRKKALQACAFNDKNEGDLNNKASNLVVVSKTDQPTKIDDLYIQKAVSSLNCQDLMSFVATMYSQDIEN